MLLRLDTVLIPVRDMESAEEFYELLFGPASFSSEHLTSFMIGEIQVGLHLDADAPKRSIGITPCFQIEDIEKFKSLLADNNAKFSEELHETSRGFILDFFDTEGHHLQAIQLKK